MIQYFSGMSKVGPVVKTVIRSIGHSNTILPEILGYGTDHPTHLWGGIPSILTLSEDSTLNFRKGQY